MVDALREYGIASDDRRVVTFSWGVDTRVFCPLDPASRRRLRAELGLPQEKIVVVLPRSLLPVYQNLEIVELLAQLPSPIRGRLEICLLSGFGQDDAYRARVEESLRATGISHRILAGPIPREMVAKHLQCCDVAVSAPRVDQRSTTVLECFACVPEVVLLDLPVYREFRTSGYSATFLPTLDPHDAHSQQLVLQAILASVGPGAPGKLQENWGLLHRTESADCFLEAVEALYGKCLDERVRRPA
jgi:glycosyltransferase involved in cell wall biosynthesis